MIGKITSEHYAKILQMNEAFVDWLSPLDENGLSYLLERADYARQINGASGVLIGYAHDVNYPDHCNIDWLKGRLRNFYYIDRIIVDHDAQGQGLGQLLYADITAYARLREYAWLACEVNVRPNNPKSHSFHLGGGFINLGEQSFPGQDKAVRYYAKALK